MKNILKTVTILMYLLFFTPTMIAQAESQDIKEAEGTTVEFEDVQNFLGMDHFVYQVDYPYYNSEITREE